MMKPSRTREERKNPVIYASEDELRRELEHQASQKRRQKTFDSLKEKQELLDHYANFKLPTGNEQDHEFGDFLAQRRQELDVLNKQLEAQNPELYMAEKSSPQREIKRKEGPTSIQYDNILDREGAGHNIGRVISKGELEREKRLKLREEERMRRLAGVKESVYDNEKPYLNNLPDMKHPSQKKREEEELVLPLNRKQQNMGMDSLDMYLKTEVKRSEPVLAFESRGHIERNDQGLEGNRNENNKASIKETLFGSGDSRPKISIVEPKYSPEERGNTPISKRGMEDSGRRVIESAGRNSIDDRESQNIGRPAAGQDKRKSYIEPVRASQGGMRGAGEGGSQKQEFLNKLGENLNHSEAEKKRKYREELDALVRQKKELSEKELQGRERRLPNERAGGVIVTENVENVRYAGNPGEFVAFSGNAINGAMRGQRDEKEQYGGYSYEDKQELEKQEKKKKYAEELLKEIAIREQERQKQKQEKRAQSSNAQVRMKINEEVPIQYNGYIRDDGPVEDRFVSRDITRRQSGLPSTPSSFNNNQPELDKKKMYKEMLDAQVQERKRIQSAKPGYQRDVVRAINEEDRPTQYEGVDARHEGNNEIIYEGKPRELGRAGSNIDIGVGGGGGGFFLHKGEDDEKKRAEMRNLQKQRNAEELKRQMEEKEEQKRREKQQKAEEELREKDRLERDIERERKQQHEENQKKLEREKRYRDASPSGVMESTPPRSETQYKQQPREEEFKQRNDDYDGYQQQVDGDGDTSQRRRENLGNHHPYLSRQDFNGNENASHDRVHFDPNRFPQPAYYGNMPNNMPPTYHIGNAHMGFIPPQGGYPGTGYEGQHGGNLYQDMNNYNQLMIQLNEEKLKIEKIALEEKLMLEQYNIKVKEMKLEKIQYDREIEKLKLMLQGDLPITDSMYNSVSKKNQPRTSQMEQLATLNNSYLPVLMDLKNAKTSHINNYQRILAQSQQGSFVAGMQINPGLHPNEHLLRQHELPGFADTLKSQDGFEMNPIFRQSLPSSSDYLNQVSKAQMESSFQRDFRDYMQAIKVVNPDDNIKLEAYPGSLPHHNPLQPITGNQSSAIGFSNLLPAVTELRPIENASQKEEQLHDFIVQPYEEETHMKARKTESKSQILKEKSPVKETKKADYDHKEASDFDAGKIFNIQMENNVSPMKTNSKLLRGHENTPKIDNSLLNRESMQLPDNSKKEIKQEDSSINLFRQNIKHISGISPNVKESVNTLRTDGLEVKLGEGRKSEKSLVLAEDEEEYNRADLDNFAESNDRVLEELGLGLLKSGQKGSKVSESKKGRAPEITVPEETEEVFRKTDLRTPYETSPVNKYGRTSNEKDRKLQSGEKDNWSPTAHMSQQRTNFVRTGTAMSNSSNTQGEKRHRTPRIIDPFAKAISSGDVRSSVGQERSGILVRNSHNEVNKIIGDPIESGKNKFQEDNKHAKKELFRDYFEPVTVKEDFMKRSTQELSMDDENEAYIDEEIEKNAHANDDEEDDYQHDFEIEEEEELGSTVKSRKEVHGKYGSKGFNGTPEGLKKTDERGYSSSTVGKLQTAQVMVGGGESYGEQYKASQAKMSAHQDLANQNLVDKAALRQNMKSEVRDENEQRSKVILDRLQRLLVNWGDDMESVRDDNDENKIREVDEEEEDAEKSKSKDLFKRSNDTKGRSNRYNSDDDF